MYHQPNRRDMNTFLKTCRGFLPKGCQLSIQHISEGREGDEDAETSDDDDSDEDAPVLEPFSKGTIAVALQALPLHYSPTLAELRVMRKLLTFSDVPRQNLGQGEDCKIARGR